MMSLAVVLADVVLGAPDWLPLAVGIGLVLIVATLLRNSWDRSPSGVMLLATVLKLSAIVLLALCLVEPLYRGVRPRSGANAFVLLADDSQSMTIQSGSQVRSEGLKTLFHEDQAWRARLQQDFDVRSYRFDEQLRHVDELSDLTYEGVGSGLSGALDTIRQRYQARPIAGALLFSDGNATDLATDNVADQDFEFPIYPVVDTDAADMQDIRIAQMNVSQTNFETSPVSLRAVIDAQGFAKQNLTARIVDEQDKVLEEQQQDADGNGQAEFQFRFRPEASGLSFHRFEVVRTGDDLVTELMTNASELTQANNQRWMTTDRGGGPYRILYVGGRPNWEFKFLRRALEEDAEIELRGLVRIAKKQPKFSFQDRSGLSDRNQLFDGFEDEDEEDMETYDQTVFIVLNPEENSMLGDGFPKDADTLFDYHAIILDDVEAKFFSAEQMLLIRRFVNQRGGGLMMLGGKESFGGGRYDKTPLGEVLPVYAKPADELLASIRSSLESGEAGVSWNLTREGWLQDWSRLRATEGEERRRFEDLVGLRVVNPIEGLKPGASLMAVMQTPDTDPIPALVTHRFGAGRAAALLAGDLWRWGMHSKDPKQQDLQQFWRQLVRWLVAEVPMRVAVETEPSSSSPGSRTISVSVKDEQFLALDNADVQLEVKTPDGETVELVAEPSDQAAGVYHVDYFPREDGPYRVTARVKMADGTELDWKTAGWTTQRAAYEFEHLKTNRQALEAIAERSGGEVIPVDQLDDFVASLPSRQVPVTESWTYPLWHQPWVLGLALLCLCGEWGLRRWRGLA